MFNDIIVENFTNPCHQGEIEDAALRLEIGNPVCGDRMLITLEAEAGGQVRQARFRAWGCATSVAAANVFCRYVSGRSLAQLQAVTAAEIAGLLGELEPSQHHCLDMLHKLFGQLAGGRGSTTGTD